MVASGAWPRSFNVRWTLISTACTAAPFSLQFDWLIFRRITAGAPFLRPGFSSSFRGRRFGVEGPLAGGRGGIDLGRRVGGALQFSDAAACRQQGQPEQSGIDLGLSSDLRFGERPVQRRGRAGPDFLVLFVVHTPHISRRRASRKSQL